MIINVDIDGYTAKRSPHGHVIRHVMFVQGVAMRLESNSPASQTYKRKTELGVVIVGGLLVALGIAYQSGAAAEARQLSTFDQIFSGVMIAVGGGILGAGLNTFVVRGFEHDLLLDIRQVIARSLNAQFLSDERDLSRFRGSWHHYYLTELEERTCWWYERYTFTQNPAVGSITQRSAIRDSDNNPHHYLTELGVRGQRLIVVSSREDESEASGVEIFPAPRGFQSIHTGVAIVETWDSSQLLSKAILSANPLVSDLAEGRVPDEHQGILDDMWKRNFARQVRIVDFDLTRGPTTGTVAMDRPVI